jgi:hypothetical protein
MQIRAQGELAPGSEEEVEIRAASVVAVERLRAALTARLGPGACPTSVELDWQLWGRGERTRATDPPHHRTLTVYY